MMIDIKILNPWQILRACRHRDRNPHRHPHRHPHRDRHRQVIYAKTILIDKIVKADRDEFIDLS